MELPIRKFSVGSIFLLTFGLACVTVLCSGQSPPARVIGWAGLAGYLFFRRQQSLFWIHLCIPVGLSMFAFVLTDHQAPAAHENIFGQDISTDAWLPLFLHYLSDAGLFISLLTYPFSFVGVDP